MIVLVFYEFHQKDVSNVPHGAFQYILIWGLPTNWQSKTSG